MKVHFIAIGGSVMHQLAIALKNNGHQVTGSDDHFFDPSKSLLEANGLLPQATGWHPERVTPSLDAVIVGMHSKADNPELIKAKELKLPAFSFPEFLYEHARNKQRVVIAGSHGKTTVTSMLIHVMHVLGKKADYMVGAVPVPGQPAVKLTEEAPVILLEGDEYPASPLKPAPKFLSYQQHIGVITGIAWDHVNAFPTYEGYFGQFIKFAENSCKAGSLVYNAEDPEVVRLVKTAKMPQDVALMPFNTPKYKVEDGKTLVKSADGQYYALSVFGEHNLRNIEAARLVLSKQGVRDGEFYRAIGSFKGAARRLELLAEGNERKVFRDFAHAPSKLQATIAAMKSQFKKQPLVACVELHTYSSLTKSFLPQYQGSMDLADEAIVYFNPETVARKKLDAFSTEEVKNAFKKTGLQVFTEARALQQYFLDKGWKDENLLLMSSADFGGLEIEKVKEAVVG